jgi:L-2,4-diaminobutyrate decarboxylase
VSVDNPRNLAFVPAAPTEASVLFDLVVGASSMYGGSWLEAAGAVHAENEALRWLADLAGLPPTAGGCFVSGGTLGNLGALVAARHAAATARADRPARWSIAATPDAHSSVAAVARVMDAEILSVPADEEGRLTGSVLERALRSRSSDPLDGLFAVVATAGTTNAGRVDDLGGVAEVCAERKLWLHVDGAYGGAALAAPSVRDRFDGIERADSFIVDPHKWLFAPFDCCALLYRDPDRARAAHSQKAAYLDAISSRREWDPSDYAVHLSRRARGLPFWFSLATHGTDAYRHAVETTLQVARGAARLIDARPEFDLVMEPELSVVLFRRKGWSPDDYRRWSEQALADQLCFTPPTTWRGETVMRFCLVNPRTTVDDVAAILDSMTSFRQ